MIYLKPFLSAVCLSVPVFLSGCHTNPISESNRSFPSINKLIDSSSQGKFDPGSLLLVGLKPYLGRGTTELRPAQALHLKSAGKPLSLKDGKGVFHKSDEITLTWRKVPLLRSRKLVRQVVGPFASFESAQRLARKLRTKGFSAVIAHPQDWEIWLPEGVKVPNEIDILLWNETITAEIQPVLKGHSGELLLSGPLQIDAPEGLYLNGDFYFGPFLLKADAYGSWTFIEQVPLERYLQGVLPHEIGSSAPFAALAAQAVLARTWALANSHRFAIDGYHLCSDTQCQVYKNPKQASQTVKGAIAKTAGKYLSWKNKPIHAVYHASNGGVMASAAEAWSMANVPYLKAQLDGPKQWVDRFSLPLHENSGLLNLLSQVDGAYGSNHRRFRWTRTLKALEVKNKLASFKKSNLLPTKLKVLQRGPSGRVIALGIFGDQNQLRRVLKLDEIRRTFRMLPSTLFVVNELKEGFWEFSGGGFGHGAGLSQAGAIDLARSGWNTSEILRHYYPGTTYGTLQDLPKAP